MSVQGVKMYSETDPFPAPAESRGRGTRKQVFQSEPSQENINHMRYFRQRGFNAGNWLYRC